MSDDGDSVSIAKSLSSTSSAPRSSGEEDESVVEMVLVTRIATAQDSLDRWEERVRDDNNGNPFEAYRRKKIFQLSDEDVHGLFISYLHHLATRGYCLDSNKGQRLKCNCLHVLNSQGSPETGSRLYEAVSEWQLWFASIKKESRQLEVIGMIRHAASCTKARSRGTQKFFNIPFLDIPWNRRGVNPTSVLTHDRICKHAIAAIVGFGRKAWEEC
jgi:hypothetical protein